MNSRRSTLSAIGIDAGSRFIKAVQVRRGRGAMSIAAAARIPRVEREPRLSRAELERLAGILERQGFRGGRVVIAMPVSAESVSPIQLPPRASGAPLEEIAVAQVADAARCTPAELETRWWETVSGRRPGEGPSAFGVGLKRSELEAALDEFARAGFDVAAVDARACALARGCAGSVGAQVEIGPWVLVEVGASSSVVVVINHGVVFFARTLPEAGLDAVIEGVVERSRAERGLAEAAVLRFTSAAGADRGSLQAEADLRMRSMLDILAHEVQASAAYALQAAGGAGETRVLVAGAGGAIPGVAPYLAERMGCPAAPADVAGLPPTTDADAGPSLICALGLALHAGEEALW